MKSDQSLVSSIPCKSYHAYACGAARPVKSGCTGPSASGWVIMLAGQSQELEREVKTSKSSNRNTWEARIRALHGVAADSW